MAANSPEWKEETVQKLQVCKDWCARLLSVQGSECEALGMYEYKSLPGPGPHGPGHLLHADGSHPQFLSPPHLAQPPALCPPSQDTHSQFPAGEGSCRSALGVQLKGVRKSERSEGLRQVWTWTTGGLSDSWSWVLGQNGELILQPQLSFKGCPLQPIVSPVL